MPSLVEALGVDGVGLLRQRPLAEDRPRAGGEDALAVGVQPGFQLFQDGHFLLVYLPAAPQGDTQQQRAVLAHDVHQHLHHLRGRLVSIAVIEGAVVVPAAQAGAGLPGLGLRLVGYASLHVPHHGFFVPFLQYLARHHGAHLSLVVLEALVVYVGQYPHALVADGVEGEHRVVEVEHVGRVAVYQVQRAVVDIGLEGLRGLRGTVAPGPLGVDGVHVPAVLAALVALLVEVLRVVAFPPLALAVGLGQLAVISLRALVPSPGMGGMDAHAQRQAILAAGLGPLAHDVALGSHVHGVPGLVLAVPEVEVVVVVGQGHEEFGPHALVETDERVGLPPLGLPLVDDILEAEVLGVAILLEVHFLLPLSGVIHVAGIPVACLWLALRPPVGPDAELRVPIPVGAFIAGE